MIAARRVRRRAVWLPSCSSRLFSTYVVEVHATLRSRVGAEQRSTIRVLLDPADVPDAGSTARDVPHGCGWPRIHQVPHMTIVPHTCQTRAAQSPHQNNTSTTQTPHKYHTSTTQVPTNAQKSRNFASRNEGLTCVGHVFLHWCGSGIAWNAKRNVSRTAALFFFVLIWATNFLMVMMLITRTVIITYENDGGDDDADVAFVLLHPL